MNMVLLLVFHRHGTLLITPLLKTVSLVFPELVGYKVSINTHSPDFSDKTLVKAVYNQHTFYVLHQLYTCQTLVP